MLRNPATHQHTTNLMIRRGYFNNARPRLLSTSSSSSASTLSSSQRRPITMTTATTMMMRFNTTFNKTSSSSFLILRQRQKQLLQQQQQQQQRLYKFSTSATPKSSPPTPTQPPRTNVLPWNIVTNPKVINSLPYIGHGAYMALTSGFLMTDMITLRLAMVGGYAGLVLFHSLHKAPLQIPLRWSTLFVFVNIGAATILILDKYASMDEETGILYDKYFHNVLSRGQFSKLCKLGKTEILEEDHVLTEEGKTSMDNKLYFLMKGQAKVYQNDKHAYDVEEGFFIEDLAFQHRLQHINDKEDDKDGDETQYLGGAYGTVVTNGECTVMVWDQNELIEMLKNSTASDLFVKNMRHLLSHNLMKKLLKQREARHAKDMAVNENQVLLQRAKTKHQLLNRGGDGKMKKMRVFSSKENE